MKDVFYYVMTAMMLLVVLFLADDPDIDWRATKCRVFACVAAPQRTLGFSPAGGQPNPFTATQGGSNHGK